MLKIRSANDNDFENIYQLAKDIWNEVYIEIISIQQIEYMLNKMYSKDSLIEQNKNGHHFWMLNYNENDIGYCSISSDNETEYFLHKLYLKTDIHRKNLGSDFLKLAIANYPNLKSIKLTVNRKNYKAINFYFKNGFKIESVANFDIGNNFWMEDFIMIKTI